jgi:hypothetical protein
MTVLIEVKVEKMSTKLLQKYIIILNSRCHSGKWGRADRVTGGVCEKSPKI